jgi:hypothetical protein
MGFQQTQRPELTFQVEMSNKEPSACSSIQTYKGSKSTQEERQALPRMVCPHKLTRLPFPWIHVSFSQMKRVDAMRILKIGEPLEVLFGLSKHRCLVPEKYFFQIIRFHQ